MKFRFLLPLFCVSLTKAQVYTPPPESGSSKPAPVDSAPSSEKKAPAASPLGQEIPLLDPSAETITVGGVAIPLGDNRILKARFEKYLSQPPESDEAAAKYRETLTKIIATVSPFRPGGPNMYSAFRLLPVAASYPGDANLCSSLAESIYTAMLSKQDIKGLNQLNKSIEDEKQAIVSEGDFVARNERPNSLQGSAEASGGKGGKASGPEAALQSPGLGMSSLRYATILKRIAEIEVLKKANIAKTEAQTLRTKAQYQVSMIQWFVQRRYEHVLMAARFYNQIWKDGDATLKIDKNSDVSKLFSESVGVSPTVASLDSLSNEAIRETSKYIEAFDLMLSRGDLHTASQRLMEAFALGEFLGPVATLSL